MKKYFLTFGNERFIKSRDRIINQVKILNSKDNKLFDIYIKDTEKILNENDYIKIINKINNVHGTGRGYYWYTWKPYIIQKNLKKINNNDILFYCDSGMTIFNNETTKNRFKKLFEIVKDEKLCPTGIVTFKTTGEEKERLEYLYNTVDVFNYFKVKNNKLITHSQQCQAGIILIRKCNLSINIINKWYNILNNDISLFIGDNRVFKLKNQNMKGFRDHRHDQSIWSILCKLNKCNIINHYLNPIYQTHYRE